MCKTRHRPRKHKENRHQPNAKRQTKSNQIKLKRSQLDGLGVIVGVMKPYGWDEQN